MKKYDILAGGGFAGAAAHKAGVTVKNSDIHELQRILTRNGAIIHA